MAAEGTGLHRIGQIAIIVHDVARAVAFYRDALGMSSCSRRRRAWPSSTAAACA